MGPGGEGLDPSQDVPLEDITTTEDGQSEGDAETVVGGKSDYGDSHCSAAPNLTPG